MPPFVATARSTFRRSPGWAAGCSSPRRAPRSSKRVCAPTTFLFGGATTVDGETVDARGFLNDVNQNSGRHESAEDYLAATPETTANHRAARRVWLRIQGIEAELAARRERHAAESTRRHDEARPVVVVAAGLARHRRCIPVDRGTGCA
jgi:hypothetical protein